MLTDAVDMAAGIKTKPPELAKNAAEVRVVPFSEGPVEFAREVIFVAPPSRTSSLMKYGH
jgi:hypothetical protein